MDNNTNDSKEQRPDSRDVNRYRAFKKFNTAKMRILTLLLLTFGISSFCFGQTENDTTHSKMRYGVNLERHISVLTGLNFWRNFNGELGLAINQYGRVGHHPAAWAFFISNEMKIDNKILIGPKIGVWAGGGVGGMAMGLNVIYYTDFYQSSLRVRPEIGMGFGRWKVVYGYNIPLTNKSFEGVNKSNIGIALMFRVKKIKTIQQ